MNYKCYAYSMNHARKRC